MPYYYLHLRNGADFFEDPEGREFADVGEARVEAVASAREILAEMLRAGELLDGQRFEIVDRQGLVCEIVHFRDVFSLPSE